MTRALTTVASVAVLAAAGFLGADDKPKKPKLDLRVIPRMAFSPATVLVTAELEGGDDVEEYHCPEIEYDWDDGGKSVQEGDCAPFEAGTKIQRRFTNEHTYRRAGVYNVKVTMRRADRSFAAATVRVTVRPGLGDPTRDPPQE
jgi:hypothetical protein